MWLKKDASAMEPSGEDNCNFIGARLLPVQSLSLVLLSYLAAYGATRKLQTYALRTRDDNTSIVPESEARSLRGNYRSELRIRKGHQKTMIPVWFWFT